MNSVAQHGTWFANYPPTANVLCRTRWIRTSTQRGAGVLTDIDGQQYLVTAKHLFESTHDDSAIEVPHEIAMHVQGSWESYSVEQYGFSELDVAVLKLDMVAPMPEIQLGKKGAAAGQEAIVLGFPDGFHQRGPEPECDTLPIIGRATLSAFDVPEKNHLLIQGNVWSGFSGGPVVLMNDPSLPSVCGIISAHKTSRFPKSDEGDENVMMPTGFVICVDIEEAVSVVRDCILAR